MKNFPALKTLLLMLAALPMDGPQAAAENWQSWRGPRGDGTSSEKELPEKWNGRTGENIAWKVALPGVGHASPITWEDRIFTVSTLEATGERLLLC